MTRSTLLRLLTSGHGRAAKFILERGADEFEDLIWKAIDARRSLYVMAPEAEYFATLILALSNPDPIISRVIETIPKGRDLLHQLLLRRIVVEIALRGRKECRQYVFTNWKAALADEVTELVMGYLRLRRSAAVPFVIGEAKRLLKTGQPPRSLRSMPGYFRCVMPERKVDALVRRAMEESPELEIWRDWVLPDPADSEWRFGTTYASYEEVVAAMDHRRFMWHFPKFALSSDDLVRLREGALAATDHRERERFLFPFAQQPWPGDIAPLLEWATGDDGRLRSRAVAALVLADPSRARALAFQMLEKDPFDRRLVAELLDRSCLPEDEATILNLWRSATTSDERYWIETELSALLRSGRKGFARLRREVYEASETDDLRGRALDGIIRAREASDELLEECLHDSFFITRRRAKRELRKRAKRKARAEVATTTPSENSRNSGPSSAEPH